MLVRGHTCGHLFQRELDGERFSAPQVGAIFNNIFNGVKLYTCSPHSFRTTGARFISAGGGDVDTIMRVMRCQQANIVVKYLRGGLGDDHQRISANGGTTGIDPLWDILPYRNPSLGDLEANLRANLGSSTKNARKECARQAEQLAEASADLWPKLRLVGIAWLLVVAHTISRDIILLNHMYIEGRFITSCC